LAIRTDLGLRNVADLEVVINRDGAKHRLGLLGEAPRNKYQDQAKNRET
jgi:hypothetical protein